MKTGFFRDRFGYFSKEDHLNLFLVLCFPIHLWMVLAGFKHFDFMINLTSVWGGVGFLSYVLSYALLDSILLYLMTLIISVFTPTGWTKEFRFHWLVMLGFTLFFLSILERFILFTTYLSNEKLQAVPGMSYPVWVIIIFGTVLIVGVVLVPWLMFQRSKLYTRLNLMLKALSPVSILYVVLDVCAILILFSRNIS